MFTGLIEEVGKISAIIPYGDGIKMTISAQKVMDDLAIDDSISVNGCCQTVIEVGDFSFSCIAVEETLKKTTLGKFKPNEEVNLERALLPTTRMGGHFVSGHVDTVGEVFAINKLTASWEYFVRFEHRFSKYLIEVGSITIDGTSLTVAETKENWVRVAIIPHTFTHTVFHTYQIGSHVNLEFDLLGKYIEKLLHK